MTKPRLNTLLLLIEDERILLAMKKRGFGVGMWNGAGGKVEANESIEQAMIRETQEEIGITPLQYRKMAIHTFTFNNGQQSEVHTYTCSRWQGNPVETEEMAPRWFHVSAIPYDRMWPDDIMWLPMVLNGKKLVTQFSFDSHNEITEAHLKTVKQLSKL